MKISILDDYHDTLRTLACFRKLEGHDIEIWNDHVQDVETLFKRLKDTEALVLICERTQIRAPLSIDFIASSSSASAACSTHRYRRVHATRVIVSSSQHADSPSYAAAELTWGLVLAGDAPDRHSWRRCAQGNGRSASAPACAARAWADTAMGLGAVVAGYAKAFGMGVMVWAREASRARAQADGYEVARSKEAFLTNAMSSPCTCAWCNRHGASSPPATWRRMKPCAAGEHESCAADRARGVGDRAATRATGYGGGRRL